MSGGENEDHSWPAFVDALTTMTMILVFVMLILSVAIASLAQNVSKVLVEQIASVVDAKVDPQASPEQATRAVLDAIEKLKAAPPPPIAAAPPEPQRKIETTEPIEKTADAKVSTEVAQSSLTLSYPARQSRLDDSANAALKAFVEGSANVKAGARLDIRAMATTSSGSLTEARRVAYYRGMVLRSTLIQLGVAADKVSVSVDVSNSAADTDKVHVYAK